MRTWRALGIYRCTRRRLEPLRRENALLRERIQTLQTTVDDLPARVPEISRLRDENQAQVELSVQVRNELVAAQVAARECAAEARMVAWRPISFARSWPKPTKPSRRPSACSARRRGSGGSRHPSNGGSVEAGI